MHQFVLYSTLGCHLCDQAEALLISELDPAKHEVIVADIVEDEQLIKTYATRIPVLKAKACGAELSWPFDAVQLQAFVNR